MPLVASGGAGRLEHFAPAVDAGADAVLAASVFHFGELTIGAVKEALRQQDTLSDDPAQPIEAAVPVRTRAARNATPAGGSWFRAHRPGRPRVAVLFTVSVLGSLVYGAMTVADAWVLGWATDDVIRPSFDAATSTPARCGRPARCSSASRLAARSASSAAASIGGLVYFRLMATYRRQVTRQYLRLPLRWHQQHPTGQLLSNANADVEATWMVMMPLPMAVGVIAMLLVAVVAMLTADVVLTVVGLVIFPLLFAVNVGYQRFLSPRVTLAQQLRADVSAVAHESFDGATVVKALGREGDETERFTRVTHELRDANIAAGRVRSVFDPVLEALPTIGVLLVVVLGVAGSPAGPPTPATSSRSPSCSRSSRSRCAPSAGCSASCRAAWSAGTGCAPCSTPTGRPHTAPAPCPAPGRCGSTSTAASASPTPDRPVLPGVDLAVEPGKVSPWSGDRLGQVHADGAAGSPDRPRPRSVRVDGTTSAT